MAQDFAGICVATSRNPECDQYILEHLNRLGIRHVRVDYGYDSADSHVSRLLNTLLDESFQVLLHLVQPEESARRMNTFEAQQEWRDWISLTLDTYQDRIATIEVGSTINRARWAGYTLETFSKAWEIAYEEARKRELVIAGPNVTDYEPLYTVGMLYLLDKQNRLPDVYTNNLFVERAIQPEIYDSSVSSRALAPLTRYNLVKKARQLQRIAARHGIHRVWNGYVTWTLRRIGRRVPNVEAKQADYLTRYMVLLAASGAMERVYWGPLISIREGLIDDPLSPRPNEELVTCYTTVYGPSTQYRERPAFQALGQFIRSIPGSQYLGPQVSRGCLEAHAFRSPEQLIHVVWTANATVVDLRSLYQQKDLDEAQSYTLEGEPFGERPEVATESPIYLCWPAEKQLKVNADAAPIKGLSINLVDMRGQYYPVRDGNWEGMIVARSRAHADALLATLHPDCIDAIPQEKLLRKSRNAIWTIQDPFDSSRLLVVKQPVNLRPHKKIIERFRVSKAKRSWSGACELLRRGIQSPLPVAYFERANGTGLTENWYLCEFHSGQLSVRSFFTAYAAGHTEFEGFTLADFLAQLVPFIVYMHGRGVYFRDLSSGNVLVQNDEGALSFSLIDTARARFTILPTSMPKRISDLKRICHKLHWEGRLVLLNMYFETIGRTFTLPYRVPFHLYDLKAATKRLLR